MSEINITALSKVEELTPEITKYISQLLLELTSTPPNKQSLAEVLSSGDSNDDNKCILFIAEKEDLIVGSLTLVFYTTPTGKRARIEDVVVAENHRRAGIGMKLNEKALEVAKQQGAKTVDLTSKPERKAANKLYKKLGFELRDTNAYRKTL